MANTKIMALFATTVLTLTAGCAVGPDFSRPAAPKTARYTREPAPAALPTVEGQNQRISPAAAIQADWWSLFKSPELDLLIRAALADNPGLQAAQARLTESEEALHAGYGVFYPRADASASATRQRATPLRQGVTAPPTIFSLYTLGSTVSYALDIFGGQRRAVEGLRAQVDYQQFTTQGAYLALTANVINTVIACAAYREEISSTEEITKLIQGQVHVAQVQADAGTASFADVLSFQSQLASAEAALPELRQKLAQSEHLLASLLGKPPAEATPPATALDELILPQELPLSLPSDLVRQRPDILMAEAQLHAASAEIGVATAALFPSFTLTGDFGFNNTATSALFNRNGKFWDLGAELDLPLFRGGALWYQRKVALAAYSEAVANYRQAVLSAFAQVADVLTALQNDAEAVAAQARAVDAAKQAAHILAVNYQAGTASYLQAATATAQYYQGRLGYIQARAQRLQDAVALFTSLGGGWWNSGSAAHQVN